MIDPLSIATGALALLQVTVKVTNELRKFHDGASVVNTTIAHLTADVESLTRVLESMRHVFEGITAEHGTGHIGTLWENVARSIEDGTDVLRQLNALVQDINNQTKFFDAQRKQLRLNRAEERISGFRIHIQSYRDGLQLSLQAVILWNQVTYQKPADHALPNLSELHDDVRRIARLLNERIELLQTTATPNDEDSQVVAMSNLRECVKAAASAISSASTIITSNQGDEQTIAPSDFGDCFPTEHNIAMHRWMESRTVYEYEEATVQAPESIADIPAALEDTDGGSDSDADLETEMTRLLLESSKQKLAAGNSKGAEKGFRNCLNRLTITKLSGKQNFISMQLEAVEQLYKLYLDQERWTTAQDMLSKKMSLQARAAGYQDQLFFTDVLNLSNLLMKQNDIAGATLNARRALKGFKKLRMSDDARSCLTLLVQLCETDGNEDDAEAYTIMLENLNTGKEPLTESTLSLVDSIPTQDGARGGGKGHDGWVSPNEQQDDLYRTTSTPEPAPNLKNADYPTSAQHQVATSIMVLLTTARKAMLEGQDFLSALSDPGVILDLLQDPDRGSRFIRNASEARRLGRDTWMLYMGSHANLNDLERLINLPTFSKQMYMVMESPTVLSYLLTSPNIQDDPVSRKAIADRSFVKTVTSREFLLSRLRMQRAKTSSVALPVLSHEVSSGCDVYSSNSTSGVQRMPTHDAAAGPELASVASGSTTRTARTSISDSPTTVTIPTPADEKNGAIARVGDELATVQRQPKFAHDGHEILRSNSHNWLGSGDLPSTKPEAIKRGVSEARPRYGSFKTQKLEKPETVNEQDDIRRDSSRRIAIHGISQGINSPETTLRGSEKTTRLDRFQQPRIQQLQNERVSREQRQTGSANAAVSSDSSEASSTLRPTNKEKRSNLSNSLDSPPHHTAAQDLNSVDKLPDNTRVPERMEKPIAGLGTVEVEYQNSHHIPWFQYRLKQLEVQGDAQIIYDQGMKFDSSITDVEGTAGNDERACQAYLKAAEMGHADAQWRLGKAYEYGELRLPRDDRLSLKCYTGAAEQGQHEAELALSGWYLTGSEGVLEQSDSEAFLWARRAATTSEPPLAKAMFAVGYFTETGIGCPASLDDAKRWYKHAASLGFTKAQERLTELWSESVKAPTTNTLSAKNAEQRKVVPTGESSNNGQRVGYMQPPIAADSDDEDRWPTTATISPQDLYLNHKPLLSLRRFEYDYGHAGSSGATKRVMDFFRRRGKDRSD